MSKLCTYMKNQPVVHLLNNNKVINFLEY